MLKYILLNQNNTRMAGIIGRKDMQEGDWRKITQENYRHDNRLRAMTTIVKVIMTTVDIRSKHLF